MAVEERFAKPRVTLRRRCCVASRVRGKECATVSRTNEDLDVGLLVHELVLELGEGGGQDQRDEVVMPVAPGVERQRAGGKRAFLEREEFELELVVVREREDRFCHPPTNTLDRGGLR